MSLEILPLVASFESTNVFSVIYFSWDFDCRQLAFNFFSSCLTVTILEHTYNEASFNLRLLYSNAITLQRFSSFNPQTTFFEGFFIFPLFTDEEMKTQRGR